MKKIIAYSLSILGLSCALIPTSAQAQVVAQDVIDFVNNNTGSTTGSSVTGAAIAIPMNGAVNAVAGQITFP